MHEATHGFDMLATGMSGTATVTRETWTENRAYTNEGAFALGAHVASPYTTPAGVAQGVAGSLAAWTAAYQTLNGHAPPPSTDFGFHK